MSLRALVVGGTSGIGHGIALALAMQGYSVTVAGRSQTRGEEIVASLPGKGKHSFAPVDAFSFSSLKKLADANPSPDVLVCTQGMATLQGYTPTNDGIDQKLMLHYFSRFYLARLLAPTMTQPNARIMTVLSAGVHNAYPHSSDDFELKRKYSTAHAANAAGMYLDAGMESIAKEHPNLTVCHMCPGFVNTNWGTEMPWLVRKILRPLQAAFGTSKEQCGEILTKSFLQLPSAAGYFLVDQKGTTLDKTKCLVHTKQEAETIVQKTIELLPKDWQHQ